MTRTWSSSRLHFKSLIVATCLTLIASSQFALASRGGTEDKKNKFTVGFTYLDNGTENVCSGILITPRIIVTAKHCIQNEKGEPGTNYIFTNPGAQLDGPGTKAKVARTVASSEDLAFIVLDRDLVTTSYLRIADSKTISTFIDGLSLIGHGYGAVYETSAPYSPFVRKYPLSWRPSGVQIGLPNTFEITSNSATACRGDSGSPIVAQISKTDQVLVGIMLGAANVDGACGSKGVDGLYRMQVVLVFPFLNLMPEYSFPKKSKVTCLKGKLRKVVTGFSPRCPSGYTLKKS